MPPKAPLTPLFQRGEFLPFLKEGKEGFGLGCLHNYGLINKTLLYFFMILLDISNLEVVFPTLWGQVRAVNGVDFSQESGENVGLVGESGAGKTMLGRALMSLLPYPGRVSGVKILWKGRDLLKKREKELRQIRSREIAMVFQDPISALNPLQKIGDQLVEAVVLHQNLRRSEAMELAGRRR